MPWEKVLKIQGGRTLNGTVAISGAKNAILPCMAASVLTDRPIAFSNVPNITDVAAMQNLLKSYGVSVSFTGNQVTCQATNPQSISCDPKLSDNFRAPVLLLGPLLARLGQARVYVYRSSGDDIDRRHRPVDFHVTNLRSLGANVQEFLRENPPYIEASAPYGLTAPLGSLVLPKVSVGATQNTIMAACCARGTTTIENASIEPETLDLIKLLKSMGAEIEVEKAKRKIKVTGNARPTFVGGRYRDTIRHAVIPDRIEAGTYAIAAVITGGSLELAMGEDVPNDTILELLESEFWRLLAAGVDITRTRRGTVRVSRKQTSRGQLLPIEPVKIKTKPYPGFPTDLHPQWAALMCFSNGDSWIEESVFDNRFGYVDELRKLGAAISHDGAKKVYVCGNAGLQNNQQPDISVTAGDIRAGAALILAALARNGITEIRGIDHVERGYANFFNKFTSCNAVMQVDMAWKNE